MSKRKLAVEITERWMKNTLGGNLLEMYSSYGDMIARLYGGSYGTFKKDVRFALQHYYADGKKKGTKSSDVLWFDWKSLALIESNGDVVTYNQWAGDIRGLWKNHTPRKPSVKEAPAPAEETTPFVDRADGKEWGISFTDSTLEALLVEAAAQLRWYLQRGHTLLDLPVFVKVSDGYMCTMSLRKPLATK